MTDSDSQKKRVFFAPLNWGLGHATRILPLIKYLLKKNFKVYIAASGRSKELLQKEISECVFFDFPAYPIKYPRSRFFVTRFMFVIFPQMIFAMVKEQRKLKNLQKKHKFDLIISDNRFSLALKGVKSILISHQLRYKLPWPIQKIEWLPEYFNYIHFRKYDKILIPDIERGQTLTGELAHDMRFLSKEKLYYLGILCDMEDVFPNDDKPIDYFVIISGPEPQRTKFEKLIFRELHKLEGRVVVTLGKPEKNYKIRMGNAEIYTYLKRRDISRYMVRAKLIISRPGYTTVMEMIELGKCGLFIPTPGQIEQEYLAKHFLKNNWCFSTSQHDFEMKTGIENARSFPGFPDNFSRTRENLDKLFRDIIER